MFPRLIITAILVVAAIAFVRHVRQRMAAPSKPPIDKKTVQCAHCQVYFPRAEAIQRSGKTYCSSAHADSDNG